MDCSIYNDNLNIIEKQIDSLKLEATRRNPYLLPEQIVPAIGHSKYGEEFRALQLEYESTLEKKNSCLENFRNNKKNKTTIENSDNKEDEIDYNKICKENYGNNVIVDPNNNEYCICKNWYERNKNKNRCIESIPNCSEYWPHTYLGDDNLCYCKDGYWRDSPDRNSCVPIAESCKKRHWNNVTVKENECYCKEGYRWDIDWKSCIKVNTNELKYKNFGIYKELAYKFAFNKEITTMPDIQRADMYWYLDRISTAKMVSNYAINALWLSPDLSKECIFKDISEVLDASYNYWVKKACQLGLMGQGISIFRGSDKVTRAEFATILSRLLNRNSNHLDNMNKAEPFYQKHLEYLYDYWIIDNLIHLWSSDSEIRWYVMLMLMRAGSSNENKIYNAQIYYDTITSVTNEAFNLILNADLESYTKKDYEKSIDIYEDTINEVIKIGSLNWDARFFNLILEWLSILWKYFEKRYQYKINPTNKTAQEIVDMDYYIDNTLLQGIKQFEQKFIKEYKINWN